MRVRPALTDVQGRAVNYLRLSVTDRCNLRCIYCAGGPRTFIPHRDILRYEECGLLMDLAQRLGMRKVRLTGGEPFVRKGFADFLVHSLRRFPKLDLRVTTNATLLAPHVERLARAGLRRVNISLDTLDPQRFARITGQDMFDRVRSAMDACLEAGITVKINAVALAGINDDELPAFVELARTRPVDVRFIECMPVGQGVDQGVGETPPWTACRILSEAARHAELEPVERGDPDRGPARMYRIDGGPGRLGVISPLSCHFCDQCNRLRITSDGTLRTCLYSERGYRLRPLLRHPDLGIGKVEQVVRLALARKPRGADLLTRRMSGEAVCATRMHSIGG